MNMSTEEKYIKEKAGQENPFRVPEGYFDQLASQVMAKLPECAPQAGQVQLPERRQKSRQVALRTWFYAAACVVAIVVMTLSFHFKQDVAAVADEQVAAQTETNIDNTYMDDAADYAMLDNAEIYACLADN